jgi:dethiobiotin synthetase
MSTESVEGLGRALCEVLRDEAGAEPLAAGAPKGSVATPVEDDSGGGSAAELPEPGPERRLIVLGTGTGVGKTHVAEALLRLEARRGMPALGLKPVETGWEPSREDRGDAGRLERASFHVKHPDRHPLFAFPDPLAPSLAARRAGQAIRAREIADWVAAASRQEPAGGTQVIETAGGVFSPLSDRETNLELALALEPATWILVVPDRLGALNEAESTLRALTFAGRAPDWLVFNAPPAPDASTGSNGDELLRRHPRLRILQLGRAADPGELAPILDGVSARG